MGNDCSFTTYRGAFLGDVSRLTSITGSFFTDDVQKAFKCILKRDNLLDVGAVLCEVKQQQQALKH